jgi:hypothetical protein
MTLASDSEEVRRHFGTPRGRHRHRGRESVSVSVSLSAGEEIDPDPRSRLPIPTPDPDADPDADAEQGGGTRKGGVEQSVPEREDFRNWRYLASRFSD